MYAITLEGIAPSGDPAHSLSLSLAERVKVARLGVGEGRLGGRGVNQEAKCRHL